MHLEPEDYDTPAGTGSPHHLPGHTHYITSVILLNGRLAIMHTGQSAVAWTALMTSQEEADANSKITRINWKTSTMGGHTWAIPTTITAQRQQWFTGQSAEEPGGDDDQQSHLIIHIPEYLHTTPEVMGPKVTNHPEA